MYIVIILKNLVLNYSDFLGGKNSEPSFTAVPC